MTPPESNDSRSGIAHTTGADRSLKPGGPAMPAGQDRPWGYSDACLWMLLDERARRDPGYAYAYAEGRKYTIAEVAARSELLSVGLATLGIRQSSRVLVLLDNSLDFVALFFALARVGAWVVLGNPQLRGDALRHQIDDIRPDAYVFESWVREALEVAAGQRLKEAVSVQRTGRTMGFDTDFIAGDWLCRESLLDAHPTAPDDVIAVSYTSGTTGMPKGVLLTDRMMRVAAHAAARLAAVCDGDVLHCWEPLFHIGGSEVLVMAVQRRISLAMVGGFSVSRFWPQIAATRSTHLHFLGGVLALILKGRDPTDEERASLRVAWGGGSPIDVWTQFEERFGIPVRECYGLTEASSFVTQNLDGPRGSVGTPLPYFEVQVIDESGAPVADGTVGELIVRDRVGGLLTPGYWGNPEATRSLLRNGWLHTGDLGYRDRDGRFYFVGRKKDSIRRRGENISAMEVERVISSHSAVIECAVLGEPNELYDEDVMAVLRVRPGESIDPSLFVEWCEARMPRFHVPRFVRVVNDLPKTPSHRVRKDALRGMKHLAWDREAGRSAESRQSQPVSISSKREH